MIPDYFKNETDLSSRFKLAHFVLEWRYRNLKIIMFRTFLLKRVIFAPNTYEKDDEHEMQATELCLKECSDTIASMTKFWSESKKNSRMKVWYTLYFLIPAMLMPLVCLRNNPISTYAERWRFDILSTQNIIQKLVGLCPAASKILDLINTLCRSHSETQVSHDDNNNDILSDYPTLATNESHLAQLTLLHEML